MENHWELFCPTADSNPLLHLWSLGVEEQFYLLFPIALFLLIRYISNIKWQIIGLGLTIFIAVGVALWASFTHPGFAFYWLPPRAWELLSGALLAYYHHNTFSQSATAHRLFKVLGIVGLLLISLAVALPLNSDISALTHQVLAVLGTMLIIQGNRAGTTLSFRLLAWTPLVGVGLISYSLYLWHWPLFSLFSYWSSPNEILWYETVTLILLSFFLAFLSWRYVEKPFRSQSLWSDKKIIKWGLLSQLTLVVVAAGLWYSNGAPQRFSSLSLSYAAGATDLNPMRKNNCLAIPAPSSYKFPNIGKCLLGSRTVPNSPISFLVWGDSHADAITPVFNALAKQYDINGLQLSLSGRAALWDVRFNSVSIEDNGSWDDFNRKTIEIVDKKQINSVFLMGRWAIYSGLSQNAFEKRNGSKDTFLIKTDLAPNQAFRSGLEEIIKRLQQLGTRVWLISPSPEMDRVVPRWLMLHGGDQRELRIQNPYPERADFVNSIFEGLQSEYGIRLLDPLPHLCNTDSSCLIGYNGKAVYYDDDHLSASGSLLLTDMLRPAFEVMMKGK